MLPIWVAGIRESSHFPPRTPSLWRGKRTWGIFNILYSIKRYTYLHTYIPWVYHSNVRGVYSNHISFKGVRCIFKLHIKKYHSRGIFKLHIWYIIKISFKGVNSNFTLFRNYMGTHNRQVKFHLSVIGAQCTLILRSWRDIFLEIVFRHTNIWNKKYPKYFEMPL